MQIVQDMMSSHNTDHKCLVRELFPDVTDKCHKVFRVTIGNIYTQVLDVRQFINYPL